ncbi:hypothetical protein T492DRAFT_537718 [Pavlovales sp. CCMP2436]|nr:hypothetical protein T492DRAFT_537718 [Pavlovales sp. CCMP2436]
MCAALMAGSTGSVCDEDARVFPSPGLWPPPHSTNSGQGANGEGTGSNGRDSGLIGGSGRLLRRGTTRRGRGGLRCARERSGCCRSGGLVDGSVCWLLPCAVMPLTDGAGHEKCTSGAGRGRTRPSRLFSSFSGQVRQRWDAAAAAASSRTGSGRCRLYADSKEGACEGSGPLTSSSRCCCASGGSDDG